MSPQLFLLMNDRIQLILKTKNISASKLADEIGVQRSNISHIISGRNNPSLEFIQKLLKRFPDLNSDWIIFGKGTMYNNPDLFSNYEDLRTHNAVNDSPVATPVRKRAERPRQVIPPPVAQHEVQPPHDQHMAQETEENIPIEPEKTALPGSGNPAIVLKNAGKKIDKVIIFYSDKSCIEYTPE